LAVTMTGAIVTPAEFMAVPARMRLTWLEGLLGALGSQRRGPKWQCPAHGLAGEHALALVVREADDGRLLLYCHGGCSWSDVLRALHLPSDTFWNLPTVTRPNTPAHSSPV
jgi:hypothetical protein